MADEEPKRDNSIDQSRTSQRRKKRGQSKKDRNFRRSAKHHASTDTNEELTSRSRSPLPRGRIDGGKQDETRRDSIDDALGVGTGGLDGMEMNGETSRSRSPLPRGRIDGGKQDETRRDSIDDALGVGTGGLDGMEMNG
ncbi:hypothetical protein PFISCL1PPCAC_20546, partial [Pristionchus fissidentatus]